ncbi:MULTISPECIES: DUF4932 domain-containing protein [unclassified Fusibacter]|uniref:DUF4932 domain-containing protein n=1 Tax=unclassified Fusibacter TaxID=2624464 RepID=UPI0013E94A85|nr:MULTISPECIES: DUF4932 domain-containing protein [unclassified Fusibacter]MCK8058373.1 DUF4932 domain-containing protein [Fusibacter sp. A2]NPE20956.1 DUF4932 domain-containing protein [Fusibacter sp. A1]
MKKTGILLLILTVLLSSCGIASNEKMAVVKAEQLGVITYDLAQNGEMSILPRVELLAGVLSQTSWIRERGPADRGNEYFKELQAFFEPFKDHEAVRIAQELTDYGFTYDAPVNFILSVGSLPALEMDAEFSTYLVTRAGGAEKLEKFRTALVNLAKESDFDTFYNSNKDRFDEILNQQHSEFDFSDSKAWINDFYGYSLDSYNIIFAPAMFPGGGYSATVNSSAGETFAYQVIRENGQSETAPSFSGGLLGLTVHEFSHCFVNPSVEKQSDKFKEYQLNDLFAPVDELMSRQAYSNVTVFLNEQIIRAITYLALEDLADAETATINKEKDISRGFYLTDYTVEKLRDYKNNRDTYQSFDDFTAYLIDCYGEDKHELLKLLDK